MEDHEPILGYRNKRALLEDLYVQEGLSITQVAKRVGVSTTAVERWLRGLDIPRRGRGGANSAAKIGWRIHRVDPRLVFGLPLGKLARMVSVSESYVYKFKKGVTQLWISASSAPPQDLNDTPS